MQNLSQVNVPVDSPVVPPALEPPTCMYKSIASRLRADIESGRYRAGDKLPSVRTMVEDFEVSHPTVLRALEDLCAKGYVRLVQGSGTYVKAMEEEPAAIDCGPSGSRLGDQTSRIAYQSEPSPWIATNRTNHETNTLLLPKSRWQKSIRLAIDELHEDGGGSVTASLKQAIAAYVRRFKGIIVEPSQVIVLPGLSSAIALVAELSFAADHSIIAENPGSPKIRRLLGRHTAHLACANIDESGLSVEHLKDLAPAPKLLHIATVQNPTGYSMAKQRRLSVLNWAAHTKTVVLEDDFGSEFAFSTCGETSLFSSAARQGARVIHLGGFWGSLQGLTHCSYVLLPGGLVERAMQTSTIRDLERNYAEELALRHLLDNGDFELHLKRARKSYSVKRAHTLTSLKQVLGRDVEVIGKSCNGKQLLRFRSDIQPNTIRKAALRCGLSLTCADDYFADSSERNMFLLSFSQMKVNDIFRKVLHFAGLIG